MNKRYYEHTLPIIRGSLSNTYNRMWLFKSSSFEDYTPRKGFKCGEYLK